MSHDKGLFWRGRLAWGGRAGARLMHAQGMSARDFPEAGVLAAVGAYPGVQAGCSLLGVGFEGFCFQKKTVNGSCLLRVLPARGKHTQQAGSKRGLIHGRRRWLSPEAR